VHSEGVSLATPWLLNERSARPGRSSLMSMRMLIDTVVMFFESPSHVEDFPLCDSLLNVWIVDSKIRTCSLIVSRVSQEGAKSQLTRIPRAVQPSCNLKPPNISLRASHADHPQFKSHLLSYPFFYLLAGKRIRSSFAPHSLAITVTPVVL